jgi:hypothetical protein
LQTLTLTQRVGADVFALHAKGAAAIQAIIKDAATARSTLGAFAPTDAHGRRFKTAALAAFAHATTAGSNYTTMLVDLHNGDRPAAFSHAKAALIQLSIFGRKLKTADTIAELE